MKTKSQSFQTNLLRKPHMAAIWKWSDVCIVIFEQFFWLPQKLWFNYAWLLAYCSGLALIFMLTALIALRNSSWTIILSVLFNTLTPHNTQWRSFIGSCDYKMRQTFPQQARCLWSFHFWSPHGPLIVILVFVNKLSRPKCCLFVNYSVLYWHG